MAQNCKECGAETDNDKYCSRKCANEGKRNKKKVSCDYCDGSLKRRPSRIKNHVFCDKKCMAKYNRKREEVNCKNCGETIEKILSEIKPNNFCNKKCSAEYLEKTIEMSCEECGEKVTRRPSTAGSKAFCSKECQLDNMTNESEREYPQEFNKKLKRKIRKKDLQTCQICGIANEKCREKYGAQLDIHHMDEDKNNNSINNLTALCRSCHGSMRNQEQAEKLRHSKHTMSYKKGYRRENQCVKLLQKCGFEAERSQNPAYSSGDYFGLFDVIAMRKDRKPRLIQVKSNRTDGAMKEILESEFIPETHFEVEIWVAYDNDGWRVERMNSGEWNTLIDERNVSKNYGAEVKEKYE